MRLAVWEVEVVTIFEYTANFICDQLSLYPNFASLITILFVYLLMMVVAFHSFRLKRLLFCLLSLAVNINSYNAVHSSNFLFFFWVRSSDLSVDFI